MKPILEIKNISKKYKLRGQESPYLTFRDALISGFKQHKSKDEFWALNNVSFDVYPGESIGIIGRNGAGKSTMLKILSRITPPTTGEIISRGRIASLLEVGTGFHGELSGRENIFLNGSILGLTKKEITQQFDAIVDFSGVEKFLDTPLKHYSSGMQLRLAFAVAAHLEPEILIVDEVLAVGDAEFQKKCLTKMDEVGKSGKSILFVSHNLNALQSLCTKGIILVDGKLHTVDKISNGISTYLNMISTDNKLSVDNKVLKDTLILENLKITPNPLKNNEIANFYVKIVSKEYITMIYDLAILIYDKYDNRIAIIDLRNNESNYTLNEDNFELKISGEINSIPFVEGEYKVGLFINSNIITSNFFNIFQLNVERSDFNETRIIYPANVRGLIELKFKIY